ncbi:hypothetical protein [Methylobacterium sp. Leaf466]|nr:hypothetical protein [Methylobacterium sp. Leaf466]
MSVQDDDLAMRLVEWGQRGWDLAALAFTGAGWFRVVFKRAL